MPLFLDAGIVFGFGCLNKYNLVILLLSILPVILLTVHRKIFFTKQFYSAVPIALLIIALNIFSQSQNNFPSFYHLKTLSATQLVYVNHMDFLKEQVFFL